MKLFLFLIVFLVGGGFLIISNFDLALYNPQNVEIFFNFYLGWCENIYSNLFSLTGNVIGMNWTQVTTT